MDEWERLLRSYTSCEGEVDELESWNQTDLLHVIMLAEAELKRRHDPVYGSSDQPGEKHAV